MVVKAAVLWCLYFKKHCEPTCKHILNFNFLGKREAYIHLFNNNISFIESRAFQRKVEGSLSIDLSNNAIESMPANLFANHIFIIIDLGCNPIEDLSGMCENNCSISCRLVNTRFLDRVNFEHFTEWATSKNITLGESSCLRTNV